MIFRPHLIEAIRRGEKIETRRLVNDNQNSPWGPVCPYKEGRVYKAAPGRAKKGVLRIRLTEDPYQETLGEMDNYAAGREGLDDLVTFQAEWLQINHEWDPDAKVWVVCFTYEGEIEHG